jgi:hypothetical protein
MESEEQKARKRASAAIRLAASTSFTAEEVDAMDEIVRLLLRGADMRQVGKSPVVAQLGRKVQVMRATLERQREKRAAAGRSR